MSGDLKQKTGATAKLYFDGYPWDRPFDLWRAFDPGLAKDLSLFITGQMYAREKVPHPTRQLIAVAALTALERGDELRLHIWAALN
ncbi:MAG: carboxymuconolactone decarboxylase family protein, partial [Desulfarculus sp.]|nr:carboxymuconolactone decarboxylase family protein [Desulfarculus sp.]